MFSLLTSLLAGSFFRTAEGAIKSGWEWLFSSATHILEGLLTLALIFGLIQLHGKHSAQKERDKARSDLSDCQKGRKSDQAQWKLLVKQAKAATAQAEQQGRESADDAQATHKQLVENTAGFDTWKRTHRVQPAAPSARQPAPGPGQGDTTAVHADAPALPTMAISDADAANWKANADYAQSCYVLGQDLISRGLAVPQK